MEPLLKDRALNLSSLQEVDLMERAKSVRVCWAERIKACVPRGGAARSMFQIN